MDSDEARYERYKAARPDALRLLDDWLHEASGGVWNESRGEAISKRLFRLWSESAQKENE